MQTLDLVIQPKTWPFILKLRPNVHNLIQEPLKLQYQFTGRLNLKQLKGRNKNKNKALMAIFLNLILNSSQHNVDKFQGKAENKWLPGI